ncbi:MAG: EamA family transporter [Candidatus Bathyarchaeia archaeon]
MQSKAPGLVFGALCVIWGSTWLGIKIGLEFLPSFLFAGLRFATATASLILLARLLHARMPRGRASWILMLFLGIFQITLPYGLVFWGEEYVSSGLSAVLFATLPFFVAIFAHMFTEEKLTGIKVGGIILSFCGLIAIFWKDLTAFQNLAAQYSILGSLAIVGSEASGGLANVVAKRHAEGVDPVANVLVQHSIGAAALLSFGLVTESTASLNFTPAAIVAVLYLGVVGSAFGFIGLYWLLKRASATNTSMVTFLNPIVALLLGWVVLQEVPDPNVGIGAVLILAGVYITLKPLGRHV